VLFVLTILASTPNIDAFITACDVPVDGFAMSGSTLAPAAGRVRSVKGQRLELSHCYFENHEVHVAHTVLEGLTSIEVKEGDTVARAQRLGRGKATVHIEGLAAADFVRGKEHLFVPSLEPVLVVVDVDAHRAVRFMKGRATDEWEVGHGQAEGTKETRGDLKTPRGLYFVVERSTGPFAGDFAAYFGGAWVKLNYPNAFDAARGLDAGVIDAAVARDIGDKWKRRAATPQRTGLGGGIGFHGWNAPWDGPDGGYDKSWGCVVMHPEEVRGFYELVPTGSAVVLL